MALVVVCGQPCSGKSTAVACLTEALQQAGCNLPVKVVSESSFHLDRNQSYADMPSEKNLRRLIRSEVHQSLSRDNIIIVDSLNSIKRYRMELWGLAIAPGTGYCVIHCDADVISCRKWNEERKENSEPFYNEKIFGDLVRRFERPNSRNRWDSPLFELFPSRDKIEKTSEAIIDAVTYLMKKVDSRTKDVRVLQPTIATQNARATEENSLYEFYRASQEAIEAHSSALGGPLNGVSIGQGLPNISISESEMIRDLKNCFAPESSSSKKKCTGYLKRKGDARSKEELTENVIGQGVDTTTFKHDNELVHFALFTMQRGALSIQCDGSSYCREMSEAYYGPHNEETFLVWPGGELFLTKKTLGISWIGVNGAGTANGAGPTWVVAMDGLTRPEKTRDQLQTQVIVSVTLAHMTGSGEEDLPLSYRPHMPLTSRAGPFAVVCVAPYEESTVTRAQRERASLATNFLKKKLESGSHLPSKDVKQLAVSALELLLGEKYVFDSVFVAGFGFQEGNYRSVGGKLKNVGAWPVADTWSGY